MAAFGEDQEIIIARGLMGFQLGSGGAFTGRVRLGGKSHPFSGAFDATGFSYIQLEGGGIIIDDAPERLPSFESLNLSLGLNFETRAITATINYFSELNSFTVESVLQRTSWNPAAGRPCPIAGQWTLTLAPPEAGTSKNPLPTATGHAIATIRADGRVLVTGTLGDGTTFTTTSTVDDQLALPLHAPLYQIAGAISGVLRFPLPGGPTGSGDFFWSRPGDETSGQFPLGFDVHVNVEAAKRAEPE